MTRKLRDLLLTVVFVVSAAGLLGTGVVAVATAPTHQPAPATDSYVRDVPAVDPPNAHQASIVFAGHTP